MKPLVLVLALVGSATTAHAASSVEHSGVRLALHASASRPGDGAWVTEVSLSYQTERRTRIRVTRVRVWNGDQVAVVPFSLTDGSAREMRKVFWVEGDGHVRVHASSGVGSSFDQIELVVRFGGQRFVLRKRVERDTTPMPGEPPEATGTGPQPERPRLRVDVMNNAGPVRALLVRAIRARIRDFEGCFMRQRARGRVLLVVEVQPDGRLSNPRVQRVQGAHGDVGRCVQHYLRRVRLPETGLDEPVSVRLMVTAR